MKVSYNEISGIFENRTIWTDGYEEYWYQKAWSVIDSAGGNQYDNDREYYDVVLRAATLLFIYEDFCGYAFDEHCGHSYNEDVHELISDVVIGQLLAQNVDLVELIEDPIEALLLLTESKVHEVVKILRSSMNDTEIFAGMYYTANAPSEYLFVDEDYDDEEINQDCEEFEDVIMISSYQDYWEMVSSELENIANNPTAEAISAFEWIASI